MLSDWTGIECSDRIVVVLAPSLSPLSPSPLFPPLSPLSPSPIPLPFLPFHREAVECDLNFCGLLVMENKLKPQTSPVIRELQQANIRTVMITGTHRIHVWPAFITSLSPPSFPPTPLPSLSPFPGDNLLTAVAVAGNCGMIGSHHRTIVIKANRPVNNQPRPSISYHVLGSEGVNPTLLCGSMSSVDIKLEPHPHDCTCHTLYLAIVTLPYCYRSYSC